MCKIINITIFADVAEVYFLVHDFCSRDVQEQFGVMTFANTLEAYL